MNFDQILTYAIHSLIHDYNSSSEKSRRGSKQLFNQFLALFLYFFIVLFTYPLANFVIFLMPDTHQPKNINLASKLVAMLRISNSDRRNQIKLKHLMMQCVSLIFGFSFYLFDGTFSWKTTLPWMRSIWNLDVSLFWNKRLRCVTFNRIRWHFAILMNLVNKKKSEQSSSSL